MPLRSFRRTSIAVATLAALGLVVGLDSSGAASTPDKGSVSDAARAVSWTGGPFAVANPSAQALDGPDCSVPSSCDDFALHVDTPAGYGDRTT